MARYSFHDLIEIMARLRGPSGCPWDLKQTHSSLQRYLIEETYEVIDAIDQRNMYKLCEELGDLLLQVVFHAQIAQETGDFSIDDVVDSISAKLVRRHPHVFGNITAATPEQVMVNWEQIKAEEREEEGETSFFAGIPKSLPALLKADKVQTKAARYGFDWPDISGVLDKIDEELRELRQALKGSNRKAVAEELGDMMFALVNAARFLEIDPEDALNQTTSKFMRRFSYIDYSAKQMGRDLQDMTLAEMDKLWEEAKDEKKMEKFLNEIT